MKPLRQSSSTAVIRDAIAKASSSFVGMAGGVLTQVSVCVECYVADVADVEAKIVVAR